MPGKSKGKRFASQAKEAAWWKASEGAIVGAFEKAMSEGYAGPCTVVVTGVSTVTKIRLGSRDVAKGLAQAAERGVPFESHVKTIIHEALRAEESKQKITTNYVRHFAYLQHLILQQINGCASRKGSATAEPFADH
jgi:hypothetical protein